MIQDIGPKHLDNQYKEKTARDTDYVMFFCLGEDALAGGRGILCGQDVEHTEFMTYGELCGLCESRRVELPDCTYLFAVDERSYFLPDIGSFAAKNISRMQDKYSFCNMFELRRRAPMEQVLAGATAWHLFLWYRSGRYCGVCGAKMEHDGKERMLRCADCGNMVFPRIAPAVIVAVTDGDRILMTKYAGREYKRYALIAGFTEIGETVEETVRREVMEETGIKVKNISYYKSQPWGFDGNLLLGYFCELDGGGEIHMDESELSVAEWMDYRDMPDYHEGLSLTEEMMNIFKERRRRIHEKNR
ncbi:MAG: NAD(+) diphosphatase [Alistipes sp.]|nr:NAD(+) diphosphatase [Alistipes sp.]